MVKKELSLGEPTFKKIIESQRWRITSLENRAFQSEQFMKSSKWEEKEWRDQFFLKIAENIFF